MSENFNEKDHRRTGTGQFTNKVNSESGDVKLLASDPPRWPELEGWPTHMPEPKVDFSIGDEGEITTNIDVVGHGNFSVWTEDSSKDRVDFESFEGNFDGLDPETMEQMQEWAAPKHLEIERSVSYEMQKAADRVRLDVLRRVTGARALPSEDDLEEMRESAANGHNPRHGELASVSLAARAILDEHPEAHRVELTTERYDNGDFVEGVEIFNKDGELLAEYTEQDDPADIVDKLTDLPPNPENGYWDEFVPDSLQYDNRIDVALAAGWIPA